MTNADQNPTPEYHDSVYETRYSLLKEAQGLTQLTLPEIEGTVDRIAQLVPAGNVPALILNGLARLNGRKAARKVARRDVNMLFRAVEVNLDRAVYATFFAGPAAVIWAYQNLLRLSGKSADDAFPEGVWQFYTDYALREDTARHTHETHGFDTYLQHYGIRLSSVDRMTAWVMASIHTLHMYNELLENDWRERVYIRVLREMAAELGKTQRFGKLYREWEQQRPYRRGTEYGANKTYTEYRKIVFDEFLKSSALYEFDLDEQAKWSERVDQMSQDPVGGLEAYQNQMSMLTYLDPGKYGEERVPIAMEDLHVGLIHSGYYYLIPACKPDSTEPAKEQAVRQQVEDILADRPTVPAVSLIPLAEVRRSSLYSLRNNLNPELQDAINTLRHAPIIINSELRSRQIPLAEIRQAERGIGDHPLTIFDTGKTFVFDQSHIFFDGTLGVAFAEIMTNEALSWARYLSETRGPKRKVAARPVQMLRMRVEDDELDYIRSAPRVMQESSAESSVIDLWSIRALRRIFKGRSDLLLLTVNDLLVLYRAVHLQSYQPDPRVIKRLEELRGERRTRAAANVALQAFAYTEDISPTSMIPIDASQQLPRDRIFPLSFEVPLSDLDILPLHKQTIEALRRYSRATGNRNAEYEAFKEIRDQYLSALATFGAMITSSKEIAAKGESDSVAVIKLMAHIPTRLQRMLDKVPSYFDVLNDLIKGREVFSNVGAVVPSSTLSRFITAKDDNEQKTLAWGVLSTAEGQTVMTLRDFRPHVVALSEIGERDLANQIAQDYLDAYTKGLNDYVRDLRNILLARPIESSVVQVNEDLAASDPLIGQNLGDFRVDSIVKQGAAAHTYYGVDISMGEGVILRVVDAKSNDRALRIEFNLRKVMTWENMHIERIYTTHVEGEILYVVSQYVRGQSLAELLSYHNANGKLVKMEDTLRIGKGIARGLDYAHEHDLLHFNLKPSNIMLNQDGEAIITDFGLAIDERRRPIGDDFPPPYYVSPEQVIATERMVPASEVYSLGVMMFQMLTGTLPFDAPRILDLAQFHKIKNPPLPRGINPDLNVKTERVLLRALRKDPEKRFESAWSMMLALEEALHDGNQTESMLIDLPPLPAAEPSIKPRLRRFKKA